MDARLAALVLAFWASSAFAQLFDYSHRAWNDLLQKHLVVLEGGKASRMDYAGMAADREELAAYLGRVSAVKDEDFGRWTRPQRMAFLINAYNAFTVEKVLTRYPDLGSIRDFGKLLGDPFKDRFFKLFGKPCSLDILEHDLLERYDEPRVHYALNCASVGCPMLREEAYVGYRLERQLEEQAVRFLLDRSRNRFVDGRLEVSKLFDWYKDDFKPLKGYFARYARLLTDDPAAQQQIIEGKAPLSFLEYDWALNDARR